MRPGTPEVTLLATRHMTNRPRTPMRIEKNRVSTFRTLKSMMSFWAWPVVLKWVRW